MYVAKHVGLHPAIDLFCSSFHKGSVTYGYPEKRLYVFLYDNSEKRLFLCGKSETRQYTLEVEKYSQTFIFNNTF